MMDTTVDSREYRPLTGRTVLLCMIAFFGVIFAANAVLVYFAITTFTGLESRSAYEAGRNFSEEIAAVTAQADRSWSVTADVTRSGAGVAISVTARDIADAPVHGYGFVARLERTTHDAEDLTIPLVEGESGVYRGAAEDVAAGRWLLVIEAENAEGRVFRSEDRIVLP